jgi:hypothetical protein
MRSVYCLLALCSLVVSACGDDAVDPQGDEGQSCYPNDTCNQGLTCEAGICEDQCGDGVCLESETVAGCPADCGDLPACGDGICNAGEDAARCPADCTPRCGDDVAEGAEVCDGVDTGVETCVTQGFSGGVLGCAADCTALDPTTCSETCGNGALESGEVCDGSDAGSASCVDFGFPGGFLGCSVDCTTIDTGGCLDSVCGNDTIEGAEVCDGSQMDGAACPDLAEFNGGTLACAGDCLGHDTTGCWHATCGNLLMEGDEVCDGTDLGGLTCEDVGFAGGGTLACQPTCEARETTACAGSACDLTGYCGTCVGCSESTVCATQVDACTANADCVALYSCVGGCAGLLTCMATCRDDYPAGVTEYDARMICQFCTACRTDCVMYTFQFNVQCP